MSSHSSSQDATDTPLTLNDWLRAKKQDLRPESRSKALAIQATQALDCDKYEDAMVYYSKAIELTPHEWTLYANRAFCYDMSNDYESALSDTQRAIDLNEEAINKTLKSDTDQLKEAVKYRNKLLFWRKAHALRGLKRFQEAIDALVIAKSIAIWCKFIDDEIRDIKLEVICGKGYDMTDVKNIADSNHSIDSLIAQLIEKKKSMLTDSETNETVDYLPSNPFRYRGLYINGLAKDLEEEKFEELMQSCGDIIRCRVYSNEEKSRAIITFVEEEAVRKAIRTIRSHKEMIQNESLAGLVIRYRNTFITEGLTDPQTQFTGTEIAGECFKWRTTGCDDKECNLLHIPICLHLDQIHSGTETESTAKRKRQIIVFDLSSSTDKTLDSPHKRSLNGERKMIKSDLIDEPLNGFHSTSTPTTKFTNSFRRRYRFDIDAPVEDEPALPLSPIKFESSSSAHKVIRLSNNSMSDRTVNDLKITKVNSSDRKRIVFDIKPDSTANDNTSDSLLPNSKQHYCPINRSDRDVTSYDDLFD